MRTLLLGNVAPWPQTTGTHVRVATTARALAGLGELDVFCLVDPWDVDRVRPPDDGSVARLGWAPRPTGTYGGIHRLRWLLGSRLPPPMGVVDHGPAREAFAAWCTGRYDLVWVVRPELWCAFRHLVEAPAVCDLDDLEDRKLAGNRRLRRRDATVAGYRDGARGVVDRVVEEVGIRRWRALQLEIAGAADRVVLCSELDRSRLGRGRIEVIPNSYPAPAQAAGRTAVGSPPVCLLVGQLGYGPNTDGAEFFAREVLPRLRRRHPDVRLRLVGRVNDRIEALASLPGVEVAGFVPDVEVELARADLAVVPLRFGSGTRVKILEAFAHGIPVVSTAAGAEGLDVVPGRDLLLADDPEDLADACHRVLVDGDLRRALVAGGRRRWRERYETEVVVGQVQAVARQAAGQRIADQPS